MIGRQIHTGYYGIIDVVKKDFNFSEERLFEFTTREYALGRTDGNINVGGTYETFLVVVADENGKILDHRSGLPEDRTSGSPVARVLRSSTPVRERRVELARRALAVAPSTSGERVYSNTGYIVAGTMIEVLLDTTWEAAIAEHLFEPLGMRSAGFGPPKGGAWGHVAAESSEPVPVDPSSPFARAPETYGPAGTVHASLADWARFLDLHVRGSRAATPLISDATVRAMHRPAPGTRYACGFDVGPRDWARGDVLAHHGSNARWHAAFRAAPGEGLLLLVATNVGGKRGERACREALRRMVELSAE